MLILLIVLAFAAGIWTAMTPSLRPFMQPAFAVLNVVIGVMFLSPLLASPNAAYERRARRPRWFLGMSFVLQGIVQLVPETPFRWVLYAVIFGLLAAALVGFLKRSPSGTASQ